jgi:hypothetical protein
MTNYYQSKESIPTGIHTRIDDKVRISSAWRTFSNSNFNTQAWETFLWDGDRIIKEYSTSKDANDVVDLHIQIALSNAWISEEEVE